MIFFRKRDFVILILLILAPTMFFYSTKTFSPTGAVIFAEDLQSEVEQLALNHPLTRLAYPGSKVCILINDGSNYLSFDIDKNGKDDFTITEADHKYCDTAENEDFILEFVSYNSFKKIINENSCNSFKQGWGGNDYYFLISKFVEHGGDIVCNDEFSETYCAAINFCYTPDEITAYRLDCCSEKEYNYEEFPSIEKGTTVERDELEEPSVYESPSPDFPMAWIFISLALVILSVAAFAIYKVYPGKTPSIDNRTKQIQDYIQNTLRMGYSREQIYYALLQRGWPKDILDSVFQKIYKQE